MLSLIDRPGRDVKVYVCRRVDLPGRYVNVPVVGVEGLTNLVEMVRSLR